LVQKKKGKGGKERFSTHLLLLYMHSIYLVSVVTLPGTMTRLAAMKLNWGHEFPRLRKLKQWDLHGIGMYEIKVLEFL
jgi:hypothetical protein